MTQTDDEANRAASGAPLQDSTRRLVYDGQQRTVPA